MHCYVLKVNNLSVLEFTLHLFPLRFFFIALVYNFFSSHTMQTIVCPYVFVRYCQSTFASDPHAVRTSKKYLERCIFNFPLLYNTYIPLILSHSFSHIFCLKYFFVSYKINRSITEKCIISGYKRNYFSTKAILEQSKDTIHFCLTE